METAIIWGWILTAQMPGMPAIVDPTYGAKEGARCEAVAAEFVSLHPTYTAYCDPTWKPDSAPRKVQHYRRVARR